ESVRELRRHGRLRGVGRARPARDRDARGDEPHAAQGRDPMSIVVREITKRFGAFTALDDVSLDVPTGSLTALLGPSGSGKSTLLRVVAGLENPDSGEVLIAEEDVTAAAPQRRGVGFVFQHYGAFKHMSVYENVAF